ncbi:94f40f1a-5634-4da6-9b25-62e6d01b6a6b [Thermothielavioides terrestris]|uniref:94f40f1a-5634-4da6-9b25-62e6d01b6a6b n=1 Tax=Thermothielavioides terrestris TaxID=2587410 RepID=A0A3S4AUF7_9PEZI|nr:94f40f1a-5634-4da6-9b25-62e6d01b6a6b [Thermothielavioides terrestris]
MGRASDLARQPPPSPRRLSPGWIVAGVAASALVLFAAFPQLTSWSGSSLASGAAEHFVHHPGQLDNSSPYGKFPQEGDSFHFLPCTPATLPPALEDSAPERTWAARFDPVPEHWSWGAPQVGENGTAGGDPYAGRGIYLCGYLDVPLDYTNKSDTRIARLAVTKFQVSGLARVGDAADSSAGRKSERTIVIEPGGPGGSGTSYAWRSAQNITERFTDGKFDVLGWDPRGVNASLPAVACFPHDASRDHWSILTSLHHAVSKSPREQLEIADAMNAAIMRACWERQGDLGRFLGTGMVARDLEQIRIALGEDELTGYLVSYGTGIGQTYASMFPDRVGRLILDGTEYVRDHRLRGGFGWTALDNATDAWRDGFLGECVNAGPEHCALAKPKEGKPVTLSDLEKRMDALLRSLATTPVPAYLPSSGPTLVTYSALVDAIYRAMYNARSWPSLAQTLSELEDGNSTLAASILETSAWYYDPETPCSPNPVPPSDAELTNLVICADSYDASGPDDLGWWLSLWGNMTSQNWIAGDSRFYTVLPCRHYTTYWPQPVGVYRGDLNHTLKHPVLLIAETYDPATPLRNGRRLLHEMGDNARLIVHHGYGHSSRDTSSCTESIARAYILNGTLPDSPETNCYADEKPYLYGVKTKAAAAALTETQDPVEAWQEHLRELVFLKPGLSPAMMVWKR